MDDIVWVQRCMIVPASVVDQCRALAAALTPAAAGMWTTGLSPTGAAPATHFICSGLTDEAFADLLDSPEALASGANIDLADATALLAASDISEDDPHAVMERLGLQLVVTEELPDPQQ